MKSLTVLKQCPCGEVRRGAGKEEKMSVKVMFECEGCLKKTEFAAVQSHFESFSGQDYGFGVGRQSQISDLVPDGWVAFDSHTSCTYCPVCWQDIIEPSRRAG